MPVRRAICSQSQKGIAVSFETGQALCCGHVCYATTHTPERPSLNCQNSPTSMHLPPSNNRGWPISRCLPLLLGLFLLLYPAFGGPPFQKRGTPVSEGWLVAKQCGTNGTRALKRKERGESKRRRQSGYRQDRNRYGVLC